MLFAVMLALTGMCQLTAPGKVPRETDAAFYARIRGLIDQLGNSDYRLREEATKRLAQVDERALAPLRVAAGDSDPEVAWRARRIVAAISKASEYQKLRGTWTYTSLKVSGMVEPGGVGATLELNGHSMVIRRRDGSEAPGPIVFRLDGESTPKRFSLTVNGQATEGIYLLEGDTLTLCYSADIGGRRPTEFETKPGDRRRLHVLKRTSDSNDNRK